MRNTEAKQQTLTVVRRSTMNDDLVLNLSQHEGKQVQSVHVLGDQRHYDRRKGDDEGLESVVITFTDGTRLVASYWTSEMGGLIIEEGEAQ